MFWTFVFLLFIVHDCSVLVSAADCPVCTSEDSCDIELTMAKAETTLDPSFKHASVSLSQGNLRYDAAGQQQRARTVGKYRSDGSTAAGGVYFEYTSIEEYDQNLKVLQQIEVGKNLND